MSGLVVILSKIIDFAKGECYGVGERGVKIAHHLSVLLMPQFQKLYMRSNG